MMNERVLRLPELVNSNEGLVRRGQHLDTSFLLEIGNIGFLVQIRRGRIDAVQPGPFVMPRWDFALRAPADEWARFFEDIPPPGHHDLMAMIKRRELKLEGNVYPFMSNLFYFKAVLASLRPAGNTSSVAPLQVAARTEGAVR